MYENIDLSDGSCCGPSMLGLRMLTFADGSQVGIAGLDAVMEIMYQKGKSADSATVAEIMERLQNENDFDSSYQQTYEELFLLAYQSFLEMKLQSVQKQINTISNQKTPQKDNTKGVFNLFKEEKKAVREGCCCNIRIVPKEDAIGHKQS